MKPHEIKPGKTYHNGGKRKRIVLAIVGIWVHYKIPSDPRHITAVWINDFAKWAKGEVMQSHEPIKPIAKADGLSPHTVIIDELHNYKEPVHMCIGCGYIVTDRKSHLIDGLRCPKCNDALVPVLLTVEVKPELARARRKGRRWQVY